VVVLWLSEKASASTTSTAISQDSTLLAAGSAGSCVRVWSLKGELLKSRSLNADGEVDTKGESPGRGRVCTAHLADKDRSDNGTVVRKLIGHSGPVYSLSFDPMAGASAPPNHLLSSSQDGSVRLWSLETWQNLVLYRGHSDPVWDVQWAPMGVHFATASRDRTARLWMTERIAPVRMYAGHLSDVEVGMD
jgi:transcription initiation factor TFIID subunit 5